MRHHSARVVLAACLLAATVAAQAPLSSNIARYANPFHGRPTHGGQMHGGPMHGGGSVGRESWSLPSLDTSKHGARKLPQDSDYSLRGMFQQAHGAFMSGKGRYEPMASVSLGFYPNQRVNHNPGDFDVLHYGFDADFPFVLSPDGYLLLGVYSKSRTYEFTSSTTLGDETVHGIGVKFGFGAFLDENTLLEVEVHPGVWSDLDAGLHHEDYDYPAFALMTWRATKDLYWKAGLRYNQIYEDAPWLPYLGVSWDITGMMTPSGATYEDGGAWRLDVMLPEYLELSYWPTTDTGLTWGIDVAGAEYHVRTSLAAGRQRDDLRVQEVTTHLGFIHRWTDTLSLQARAGAVIAGDYGLTTGAAGFAVVDGALDQGFFATVSLGIDW